MLQAILDSAVDAILTDDETGNVASINPATERLFGYLPKEVLNKSITSLFASADSELSMEVLSIRQLPNSNFCPASHQDLTAMRRDGSCFEAEPSSVEQLSQLLH